MIINHNLAANNAIRSTNINSGNASKSMEKLSSGLRINRAGDDAAGLAISEKMRGQIRGLDQASANSQDAISMIQTAEGALSETHSILQRMRELSVQSATDTNTADDRSKIQAEVDQLAKEITRISNTTEFNTQNLMAGGLDNTFQIGANKDQNIQLQIGAMDAFSLGVAQSQVVSGAFTTGTTGITGTSEIGRGLTAQTYKIETTETAANVGALTGTATHNGALTGTYTGDNNIAVNIRIDTVTGGAVSAFSYSTDGGTNYTSVASNTGAIGTTGLTWTADSSTTYVSGDQTKVITSNVTAASYTAQLKDGTGATVGGAITVKYSATDATIGNSATGETMKISFNAGGLNTATDGTQVITTIGSTAASLAGDGSVSSNATVAAGINVSSQDAANKAIKTIDDAIKSVSTERSKLGAYQNRLEHTIANLGTSSENLTSAESRIRDVDMAKEMSTFSKNNILSQAAQAMLAQANNQPQQVLQLLR
ncbi:MAG: flagellin [Clostridium butyricum]|nr:flagellin [Clostridium butyricum]